MNILPPEELEKKRALEFLALSPTEKFEILMKRIKDCYEIRESRKSNQNP